MVHEVQMGKLRKRMSFSRIDEVLDMPDLIEVQKNSYRRFLEEDLREVLADVSPITDYSENLVLEFVDYSLDENPKHSVERCKERDLTYAAPLKVFVRLKNRETGEIKESDVFMGDFPLMTDHGTFIINGAERVIVSQLVRSPGVYFGETIDKAGKHLFSATVIPNRGAWLEYETNSNDVLWVRIDRARKLPITMILRALGYGTDAEIIGLMGEDERLMATIQRGDNAKSQEDGLIEIYKRQKPGEPPTQESARNLLNSLFFDPKRYDQVIPLVPVASIALDAAEIVIMAGTQHALYALVEPAEATDPTLLWSSSDDSVLSVDAAGIITAVSAGSAVITAAAADSSGIFAKCTVTVYPPVSSLMVTGQTRIQVGKTYPLTALDKELPVAAGLLAWSSSDPAVAMVDASGAVTGIMVGSAVITASVQGNPELTFDFPVEILRAATITITDSNKQFSRAVSQNNSALQTNGMMARIYSEFSLMRLLLKTDGTVPSVDEFNPDVIVGNKDSRYMIQFTSVQETEAAYNVLKNAGYVKYVAPDSIMSIDEGSKAQSAYTYHSWGVFAMHADKANEGLAATTSGVVYVAVIDTGIADHSFLSSKHYVYYDYVDYDDDPYDENGHGTHVAGTIVDLTQALDVRVAAFRVLDECTGR